MTSDRREDVERIVLALLDVPAGDRARMLDELCRGDRELRREAEWLLAGEGAADALLRTPVPGGARVVLRAAARTSLVGRTLGPYEVVSWIGAGGMGEVYKARDTRLDRTVALKILPADLAALPDRRARFEREARTISSLSHPHICTLHDVGHVEDQAFLVMEYLDGETLGARLTRGALPISQALEVAAQIAEALAAAHRLGIVHRDLKPGNVMLTKGAGRAGVPHAKLLDFGLAKLKGHGEHPVLADPSVAPTRSTPEPLTAQGAILGTLQYMAPEQVEGKDPDARTDLWALGAIVYEMVTGRRAFEGATRASLIASILYAEPAPLTALKPLSPPSLDRIVARCLAKPPDDRWDSAHDVADELRWVAQTESGNHPEPHRQASRVRRWLGLVATAAAALALGAAGALWFSRTDGPAPVVRSDLGVRPAETLDGGGIPGITGLAMPGGSRTALRWTPDGATLVFVGRRGQVQQLYVRPLDAADARPLAGTEGARVPAISADGQWIGFWASHTLRKVPVAGGPVVDIEPLYWPPTGLLWTRGGDLLFSISHGPIQRAGAETPITTLGETERTHIPSAVLPDGRTVLFTVRRSTYAWGDEVVEALDLQTGQRKPLLRDAADARYVPTGHLLFLRTGVLHAVPFDLRRVDVTGSPSPIVQGIAQALSGGLVGDLTGAGQFDVAAQGTLAWIPGDAGQGPERSVVALDLRGQISPALAPVRNYGQMVRVSPDGSQAAVTIHNLREQGLWLSDMERGALTPLVQRGEVRTPVWSRDGRHLVFQWLDGGRYSLARQPAGQVGQTEVLANGFFFPASWGPAGELLGATGRDVSWDVGVVSPRQRGARIEPLLATSALEGWPEISPDGQWLAYASDTSGRFEVYVRRYPSEESPTVVSLNGGTSPAWHPGGRQLFYVQPGPDRFGHLMVVEFVPGSPSSVGQARALFEFDATRLRFLCQPMRCYDVARDGKRFYVIHTPTPPTPPVVTHVSLVQNWFQELLAKVPVGR